MAFKIVKGALKCYKIIGFAKIMKFLFSLILFQISCVSGGSCPEEGCPKEGSSPERSSSLEVAEASAARPEVSPGSSIASESSTADQGGQGDAPTKQDMNQEGGAITSDPVSFVWDRAEGEASEIVLVISPAKYRDNIKLETWRQMGHCSDCGQTFKLDLLTIQTPSELRGEEWLKILEGLDGRYTKQVALKVLVLPGLQDSFLLNFREILDQWPTMERVILIDPGALEGLNGIVNITSTTSKMTKSIKKIPSIPSLEVLSLFTGRAFEKDRRRIMAGNSMFLYTELGMANKRGPDYLVEWFLTSRLGIKSPFAYGAASKQDVDRIRGVSPAAWFQRSQGSLTEETNDDVLKLMLP
jgi:hypothetical protein